MHENILSITELVFTWTKYDSENVAYQDLFNPLYLLNGKQLYGHGHISELPKDQGIPWYNFQIFKIRREKVANFLIHFSSLSFQMFHLIHTYNEVLGKFFTLVKKSLESVKNFKNYSHLRNPVLVLLNRL